MTDKYVDFLANVIIPVCNNLAKDGNEWCPCKFDISYHKPSDDITCEQSLFHAPELLQQFRFTYITSCMNWWVQNNPQYKTDPFLISLAEVLVNGDGISPRDIMSKIKHLIYLHIIQSYDLGNAMPP